MVRRKCPHCGKEIEVIVYGYENAPDDAIQIEVRKVISGSGEK